MKTYVLAGAALALIASAPAVAAGKRANARFDHDRDGRLSAVELQEKRIAGLMRWDRDGDQRISQDEYSALLDRRAELKGNAAKPGKNRFAKFDLDQDGFISRQEVEDRMARKFARADRSSGYDAPAQAPMDDEAR